MFIAGVTDGMYVDHYPISGPTTQTTGDVTEPSGTCNKCAAVVAHDERNHIIKIQLTNGSTRWCHTDDCEPAKPPLISSTCEGRPILLESTAPLVLHLNSIRSLSYEGVYSNATSLWRRLFVSKYTGVGVHLIEDGELCCFLAMILQISVYSRLFAIIYSK